MVSKVGKTFSFLGLVYLIYTVFAIRYICPLDESLGHDSLLVCQASHGAYHKVTPYYDEYVSPHIARVTPFATNARALFGAKVAAPVEGLYSQHVAAHVSKAVDVSQPVTAKVKAAFGKAKQAYDSAVHPHVKTHGHRGLKWLDAQAIVAYEKTKAGAIHGWAVTKVKSVEWSGHAKAKAIEAGVASSTFAKTVAIPKTLKFVQLSWLHAKIFSEKAASVTSAVYAAHVHPYLVDFYYLAKLDVVHSKFLDWRASPYGQYVESTLGSVYTFVTTKVYEGWVVLTGADVRNKISEQYAEIEHQIEDKTNFLKSEFNRIFSAGFNTEFDRYMQVDTPQPVSATSSSISSTTTSSSASSSLSSSSSSSSSASTTSSASTSIEAASTETPEPFNKYYDYLSTTSKSALENFTRDVDSIEEKLTEEMVESLRPRLRDLSKSVNSGYEGVHALIYEIDRVCPEDDEECPPVEHVSRQDFRDALAQLSAQVEGNGAELKKELQSYSDRLSEKVLAARTQTLDILQDFADAALQEYSHAIMEKESEKTSTTAGGWDEWKRFHEAKNKVFETRDILLTTEPQLAKFKKTVKELDTTLYVLVNESGQYLALLRAQANLKFQAREAREREAAKVAESSQVSVETGDQQEEEEEEFITETVVKYITTTVELEEEEPTPVMDDGSQKKQKPLMADETIETVAAPVEEASAEVEENDDNLVDEEKKLNEKLREFESIYDAEAGEEPATL